MKNKNKIYLAGPMTGKLFYNRPTFYLRHLILKLKGYKVMNPAILPLGFEYDYYIEINKKMLDACDIVYFLRGSEDSKGAMIEFKYCLTKHHSFMFEEGEEGFNGMYLKVEEKELKEIEGMVLNE